MFLSLAYGLIIIALVLFLLRLPSHQGTTKANVGDKMQIFGHIASILVIFLLLITLDIFFFGERSTPVKIAKEYSAMRGQNPHQQH